MYVHGYVYVCVHACAVHVCMRVGVHACMCAVCVSTAHHRRYLLKHTKKINAYSIAITSFRYYYKNYRIAGFFEGENFHEFHELITIRENFTLEIFPLQTC